MRTDGVAIGIVVTLAGAFTLGAPAPGAAELPAIPCAATLRYQRDTITLTLEDALLIAEGNNPAYQRAVNELDVGGVEGRATWMNQILPRVSFSLMNTGYSGNLRRQAIDFFGNPVENPQSSWTYNSNTSQQLNLTWRIQGKGLFDDLKGLELSNRNRGLAVERAEFSTRVQVRRQYYAVLRQRELLSSEIASLEAVERDLEVVQRLFRIVAADRIAVLNAQLAVEDQRRRIQQQERALDQAQLSLRTTLGDPDLPPFWVEGLALPVFDPSELDDEALVQRALNAHPDIRQSDIALGQARLGVSNARGQRWPSISFNYRLGRSSYVNGDAGALFDITHEPEDLSNSFGISFSVPYLTDYFGNRLNEVQAEVSLRNQRETMREIRFQVEQQVRSQLIALRNQYETLRGNERSYEIALEALSLSRERYRLGTLDFQQYEDQIEQERRARLQVIDASYDFANALLSLEDAVGAPVRAANPAPLVTVR